MDLELPSDMAKLTDPQLYLEQHSDKTVIIDKVQHRRDLFPLLRALVDSDRQAGRFILLGSASQIIIQDTSESLAGHIAFIEHTPFSVVEMQGSGKTQENLWLQGGFPLSILARNQISSETWRMHFL